MSSENLKPVEELQRLDQQIDRVNELEALKPIFYRLEEIAKANAGDFEVQLMVGDVKQHVVNRGNMLKQQGPGATPAQPAAPAPPPPPAAPPPVAATPPPKATPPPIIPVSPPAPPPGGELPPDLKSKQLMSSGLFAHPGTAKSGPLEPSSQMPPPPPASAGSPPAVPPAPPATIPPSATPPATPKTPAADENLAATAAMGVPRTATGQSVPPLGPPPGRSGFPVAVPPPPKKPSDMKRAAVIGALIGVVAAVILIVVFVNIARNRNSGVAVDVAIVTTPPGASVRLDDSELCVSDCTAQLEPGTYHLTAVREGYEPSATDVTIVSGQPASVSLAMFPQPQSVRIYAELTEGAVTLDGQQVGNLQDGQFLLENVLPGSHTVRVAGGGKEASFSFDLAEASLPQLNGAISTRDLLAVVVTSFANRARVITSSGPMKLVVNGQPAADTGPDGSDLADFQPGPAEMIVGEGNQQKTVSETFGAAPSLTAFLKTDENIGTLIVAANEDNVRVFLNNREQSRRTTRGQLRIQTIGRQVVRVVKDGFEELPPQVATVAKGAESRVTFTLKPLPEFSSLVITGGTPGSEVLIDTEVVGTISPDGGFRNSSISPGDRAIQIRRAQYEPKSFNRTFRRGQTVTIEGGDSVLIAVRDVTPPPTPPPPPPATTPKPQPPPVKAAAPKPRIGTLANFDAPDAWRMEDGIARHQGEAHLTYGMLPADGIFTFTIHLLRGGNRLLFRGGKVRWFLDYQDARNYALFELDDETFSVRDVVNGRDRELRKVSHGMNKDLKSWTIRIDVNAQRVIHSIEAGGQTGGLDTWADPTRNFTDGKFGIRVNGNDEVGLSDFRFTGR